MLMDPGRPTTNPAEVEPVPKRIGEPTRVTIIEADDTREVHEFPPARLWLRPSEGGETATVRARLFSEDPPEAISSQYAGGNFYFEMELPLDEDAAARVARRVAAGEALEAEDVSPAEWSYEATDGDDDTRGGYVALQAPGGTRRELRPRDVYVALRPLGDGLVDVWLVGKFQDADDASADATGDPQDVRAIRLQAYLVVETIDRR